MPDDFNKNTSIEDEIEKSLQKMVEEETTAAKAYVGKADDYKAEQPSDINDGRTRVVPKITDEILKEQQVINKSSQPTQEELLIEIFYLMMMTMKNQKMKIKRF